MSFSNISIVGNLTRDPEFHVFKESGRKKTTMTVAVNNWNKTKENKTEKTADFYRVETWDRLAEVSKNYLKKGNQVAVSGKLQIEKWLDKEGKERLTPTVKASQIALPQKPDQPSEAAALLAKESAAQANDTASGVFEGDEFDPSLMDKALPSSQNNELPNNAAEVDRSDGIDSEPANVEGAEQGIEFEMEEGSFGDEKSEGSDTTESKNGAKTGDITSGEVAQFGQTSKIVETSIPSIASIAKSA